MKITLDAIRDGATIPDLLTNLPKIPVASAISGLIVAALILMTPNTWFEAFIVETGLPGLISAAEPPLGARARIVFALCAALIVTLAAWVALSLSVGRKIRQTPSSDSYDVDESFDPEVRARALRRSDAHPDAPYRRPIMAGDDLGAPLDAVEVEADFESGDGPEDHADRDSDDVESEPVALDLGAVAEILETGDHIESHEHDSEETRQDGSDLDQPNESEGSAPGDTVEPVFEINLPPRDAIGDRHYQTDEFGADPLNVPDSQTTKPEQPQFSGDGELSDLIARLEAGLIRKRRTRNQQSMPDNVTAHPQARPADQKDIALKEALDALQQVSDKAS